MSETADREDRTEAPTPKRLREASERGDVPRSKELANVAVLGCSVIALLASGSFMARTSLGWMHNALAFEPELIGQHDRLIKHAVLMLGTSVLPILPMLAVALLACFISPLAMGGLRFSTEALEPKFERLSPMAWLRRVYGQEGVAEIIRSLLRVLIVGLVGAWAMRNALQSIPGLQRMPLESAVSQGMVSMLHVLGYVVGSMGLLAAADAPYQRWNWAQKLKMTKQEVRDEFKETEGNPEVKGKLKQIARQQAQRQMMEAVPTADVIITNPTHYAVALKYEIGKMAAPKVVALGVDEIAMRIRDVAEKHRVSMIEAPPLARALYRHSKLNQEIPVTLYAAVAQVLSYVFQLRRWNPRMGPMPQLAKVVIDPALDDGQTPR
ncbi:MAG: flagellar biosynthesis protein FlhB [Thermomonas sp.]|uniref:flagellar biosynthesis protein FlhB n=1 Tax=Thermomonas sp. TaxID=1971895 RepID=UPI001ECE5B23|nr:flagellar biosynthesis protein FlhB [Thermomonas sp.]MBV2210357.1 flagellar biosynthesis protein FlhB [Thermomonas sp.]